MSKSVVVCVFKRLPEVNKRSVDEKANPFRLFPERALSLLLQSRERSRQTPIVLLVDYRKMENNQLHPIPQRTSDMSIHVHTIWIFKFSVACSIVHAVPDAIKGVPAEHFVCGHAQLPSLNSPQRWQEPQNIARPFLKSIDEHKGICISAGSVGKAKVRPK